MDPGRVVTPTPEKWPGSAVPLLLEHGRAVTTRQIAEAAGVAEGTIFRVFESKQELVTDALVCAFDPTPLERAMGEVRRDLPLRETLLAIVGLLQHRLDARQQGGEGLGGDRALAEIREGLGGGIGRDEDDHLGGAAPRIA